MTRRRSVVVVALGVGLLLGPPVAWEASRPLTEVGDPGPIAPPAPDAAPDPVGDPRSAGSAVMRPDGGFGRLDLAGRDVAVETADLTEQGLLAVPAPIRLRIATIGVDAPVVPVGVADDGGLENPSDVASVGWFEPGPAPGRRGSAVLSGHVDSRSQGRGALFDLRSLDVDDTIEVVDAEGTTRHWRVVARTLVDKDALPADELFDRDGPPRLVVMTCGGDFDRGAGHYTHNVVVLTEPVPTPAG